MTSPCRLGFLSVSVAVLLMLTVSSARADATTPECVAANTKGQELRRDHKLSAAREQLQRCAGLSCPEVVRDDCAKRLDELEHVQPTIVFDAKDTIGNDLSAVTVTVDGRVLTEKLEGTALLIDPGEHAFVFEAAGKVRVTRTFVLKEGEKDRRERVVLDAAPPGAQAPPVAATSQSTAPNVLGADHEAGTAGSRQRVVGWIVMGAGVVAMGVGGALGLSAKSSYDAAPTCHGTVCQLPQGVTATDSARHTGNVATGIFSAGAAVAAGGVVIWLTAPRAHRSDGERTAGSWRLGVTAGDVVLGRGF